MKSAGKETRVAMTCVVALFAYAAVSLGQTSLYVSRVGSDSGDCTDRSTPCHTLSYALERAMDKDVIYLAEGVYTEAGIEIDKRVTIRGQGVDRSIVQAASIFELGEDRVFTMFHTADVVLESMTIRNGKARFSSAEHARDGGAIYNLGSLTLDCVKLVRNFGSEGEGSPPGKGGAVYNSGTLHIYDSEFIHNTSGAESIREEFSDEDFFELNIEGGSGGGIFNDGLMFVYDSLVSHNSIAGVSYGDFITPSDNGDGGGIANFDIAFLHGCTIANNLSIAPGLAGGIANYGFMLLERSTVAENETRSGPIWDVGHCGGVLNRGDMIIRSSTISGNASGKGVTDDIGIFFYDGGAGGGILNSGHLLIENSTVSGNRAGDTIDFSDFFEDDEENCCSQGGPGGGIFNSGTLVVNHSSIVDNEAGQARLSETITRQGQGGGLYNSEHGSVTLSHTLVAMNRAAPDGAEGPDCYGEVFSRGYNLLGDSTDCQTAGGRTVTDLMDVDEPRIGPLQHNGGPTLTHTLLPGSPAIEAGDAISDIDQRGYERPVERFRGNPISIGAVEPYSKPFYGAYNDLSWREGQLMGSITRFTTESGAGDPPEGSSGHLKDSFSGSALPVRLTVTGGSWNGEQHASLGSPPIPGTDAYDVFYEEDVLAGPQARVDTTGVISYGSSPVKLLFTGLDRASRYELTVFGNRGLARYSHRITTSVLQGVESFENKSSEGAVFSGPYDRETRIANGFNTQQGYVARYERIDAGEDGAFSLLLTGDDSAEPSRHYVNALYLQPSPVIKRFETYLLEAEGGRVDLPMTEGEDPDALGGRYIYSTDTGKGAAEYPFSVEGGSYLIWARARAGSRGNPTPFAHNSFFISVDDENEDVWDLFFDDAEPHTEWAWGRVSTRCGGSFDENLCNPLLLALTEGRHTLKLRGREAETHLDKLIVTSDENYSPIPFLPPEVSAPAETAGYVLTFDVAWSAERHPIDFPSDPSSFMSVKGAVHNHDRLFWEPGKTLREVAEGSDVSLETKFRIARVLGSVSSRISDFHFFEAYPGTSEGDRFEVSRQFPLVTAISWLAPSPDWFVGVSGLSLFEDGDWVEEKSVELFVYDAGTDSGDTYTSPRHSTDPPDPVQVLNERPFVVDGELLSFGTFTFRRVD